VPNLAYFNHPLLMDLVNKILRGATQEESLDCSSGGVRFGILDLGITLEETLEIHLTLLNIF